MAPEQIDPFGVNPSERLNPGFTLEDEEAGMPNELKPIVFAPPGYASPDPNTSRAALVTIEEHPLAADISPDFAQNEREAMNVDAVETTMAPADNALPEDREEWTKAQWQQQAKAHGVSTSGTAAQIRERVEAYEGELDADKELSASDWKDEIEAANAEELASIRERYKMAGADFATVNQAFDKREAEFNEQ